MNLLKFIQNKIFPAKQIILPNEFKTEDEYYTFFFTQHPKWSKPQPNKAEQLRLVEIEKMAAIFITNYKKECSGEIEIIDFGCGRGWLTNILSKYGKVTGIEPVANVVKYAQKLFPAINFEVGSIENLKEKKADLIVCSEVIEHISETEKPKYFKVFYQALNVGGYCIVTTPRAEVQREWLSYRNDDGQPVEEWLTEPQVKKLATENGFVEIQKNILKEYANGVETPFLELYQIWLFQKK